MPEAEGTMPCPRPGCDGIAAVAADGDFDGRGAAIWACSKGHHGPTLFRP